MSEPRVRAAPMVQVRMRCGRLLQRLCWAALAGESADLATVLSYNAQLQPWALEVLGEKADGTRCYPRGKREGRHEKRSKGHSDSRSAVCIWALRGHS